MKKILAIDDQKDNLVSYQAIVKSYMPGCSILTAQSGKEGIKIAQNEQPDVILLDIIMPEMNGYETCSRLKADPSTSRIPLIMITAIKTDTESKVKALESGADAFLTKPVDPTELTAQVNVMLRIKHAEDKLEKDKQNLEQLVEKRSTELFHSELRYRTLTTLAPVGVYQTDKDGKCIYVNQLWQEMAGLTPKEAEGDGWIKGIHPQDRDLVFQSWNRMVDELGKWGVEYRLQNKEGKTTWVYGTANKIVDDQGEVTGYIGVNTDITNRKESEDKISSFNKIFEDSLNEIYIFKADTYTFIHANLAALNNLGYSYDELTTMTPLDIKPEFTIALFETLINPLKEERVSKIVFETIHQRKDKSVYPVEVHLQQSRFDVYNVFVAIILDITARKKAEKTQQILFNISNATNTTQNLDELFHFIKDEVHKIIDTTNFFIGLWDGESDTVSIPYIVDKTDHFTSLPIKGSLTGYVLRTKQSLLATKEVIETLEKQGEVETIGTDSKIWLGVPMKSKGIVTGAIVVQSYDNENAYDSEDIEILEFVSHQISLSIERKQSEQIIIESEERYRNLVQNLPVGIFRSTLEGAVISANPAMVEIYGYDSVENLLNVPASDYYAANNPREQMLIELRKNGYLLDYETQEKKKDGSLIWVSANYKNSSNHRGEMVYIDGVVIDITDRKQKNEALKNALTKATESERLKSTFLATMSHELRTPLNAVIGFSGIIDETFSMEEIMQMNRLINTNGNQLLRIIEDIFDISMIETGEIKIDKEEFDLVLFLHDIHSLLLVEQDALKKQHLEITFQPPKNTNNLIIFSDQGKLKQVLLNLLKNAMKYTPEGSVEYGFMNEEQQDKSLLKFYVKDTGIGISKDHQKMIFDPFRQADETHTRLYGGAGLGLSISKKLTNILGGEIWVESELGIGSTFYFTIPFDQPEIIKPNKTLKDTRAIQKYPEKTVLIVEDEDSNYEYLKILLERVDINTLFARNGQDAIDLCQSNPGIDLVLMDIKMPVMNGYEATSVIKQNRPDLQVIAQTAHAIFGDKEKALESGCDDYISKPINKENLYQLIGKYLD